MDNKIATQNQGLTDKQQALSNKIAKTGNLSELVFAKKVVEFSKLRDLEADDISQGLSMLFTKIANLIGIKDPISNINKADIKEMILMRFKGLSLEEIDYYFKLERYGVYDTKTEHFQLFNADYVSTVLNKGKKWLQKTRFDNNIPIAKLEKPKPEQSEKEKQTIIYNGLVACYDDYIESKRIQDGKIWVHDHLMDLGLFDFTEKEKDTMWIQAKTNLQEKAKTLDLKSAKELMQELERKNSSKREIEYKKLRLKRLFGNIYVQNKHLTDLIDKR